MNKYCRICWNTNNWRTPTGEARHLETGTYVSKKGFGHEEWLFNYDWILRGYKQDDKSSYHYGFLQPINKYHNRYEGKTFSVLLYTISPDKSVLVVARIDNLYIPEEDELRWAHQKIKASGWLEQMKNDLEKLNISTSPLNTNRPEWLINVRFCFKDVTQFDPLLKITGKHKLLLSYRYQPYDWDDGFMPSEAEPVQSSISTSGLEDVRTRSEAHRVRSAIKETSYDPRHTLLQNRLFRCLKNKQGDKSICYENNYVDLLSNINGSVTFYEIKMERSAKSCIRLALGQLLEYSHYPNLNKAQKLVVVGEVGPTRNEIAYLKHIRDLYGLPIYYAQWDWAKEDLMSEV